ncbi:DUF6114 domain-containing protein [Natrinema halophilum]|uniref:Uncharacterized protein n=1 Tax=Natrinema halophilum TaxID=1699371 RepID=A0A7D5GHK5_9EURY|nr:DUF6114 domain-containing protein [Natrinema halophilum]QLG49208.1 DUF6114 domain-containing protein [Natrinema halophilum]
MSTDYRVRFAEWRRDRPFWGGTMLALAGLIIAIVPLTFVFRFGMVSTRFVLVGLLSAGIVTVSGVFSLVRPAYASRFGVVGTLFAIVSIVGALGGFGLGTILGMVGGSLCIAWVPTTAATKDPSSDTESMLSRIRTHCRDVIDALS